VRFVLSMRKHRAGSVSSGEARLAGRNFTGGRPPGPGLPTLPAGGLVGVSAVFASRPEFADAVKPGVLFEGARRMRAAGLSLNVICQQVAERQLIGS
jgi:hypothetical protein